MRRHHCSGATALVILVFAVAIACAGVPPPANLHAIRVHGRVLLPDGTPATNATVTISIWESLRSEQITTDRRGNYSLKTDSAGHVLEASITDVGLTPRIPLAPGDRRRDVKLDLQLYRIPVLAGTVYLPDGRPAANADLAVHGVISRSTVLPVGSYSRWGTNRVGGGSRGGPLSPIRTDRQGRYRLPLLPKADVAEYGDGSYLSACLFSPTGLGWGKLDRVPVTVNVPETRMDLHLQPGEHVEGRVLGYPGGVPVAGVKVSAKLDLQEFMMHLWPLAEEVVTGEDGTFGFLAGLPAEDYFIQVHPPAGWEGMEMTLDPKREVPASNRSVEVSLFPEFVIEGQVLAPDRKPLASRDMNLGDASATTDKEGRYRITLKSSVGPYGIPYFAPRYVRLAPRVPGVGVAPPVLVDDATPGPHVVNFQLAAPATITGRQVEASSGKPALGVRIRPLPVDTLGITDAYNASAMVFDEENSQIKDDETGRFALHAIPPGQYELTAGGWTIQGGLRLEKIPGVRVSLSAGETVDVGAAQVKYVPHLVGRLSGLPGKPEDYEIHAMLRPSGSQDVGREGYMDLWAGDGIYRLWAPDRPAGKYDAAWVAWKHGLPRYAAPVLYGVDLREGGPVTGPDLQFAAGATIRGKVVQADGKPLPKTAVTVHGVGGDAMMLEAKEIAGGASQMWMQLDTDEKGEFVLQGLLAGEYELTAHTEPEYYGPKPTARVWLSAEEQKKGVVLRTQRNW